MVAPLQDGGLRWVHLLPSDYRSPSSLSLFLYPSLSDSTFTDNQAAAQKKERKIQHRLKDIQIAGYEPTTHMMLRLHTERYQRLTFRHYRRGEAAAPCGHAPSNYSNEGAVFSLLSDEVLFTLSFVPVIDKLSFV